MRTALLLVAALAAAPATAQDVPACAKYADPFAYNACLARQGPAARAVHVGAAPVGHAPSRRVGGRMAPRARGGRMEMVFPASR